MVDAPKFRADTLRFLETFNAQQWHADPVQSLLQGKAQGGEAVDTIDAFGEVNGRQLLCSEASLNEVIAHCQSFTPSAHDLRGPIRAVEAVMLSTHAAALIGNQALDFKKQDGAWASLGLRRLFLPNKMISFCVNMVWLGFC